MTKRLYPVLPSLTLWLLVMTTGVLLLPPPASAQTQAWSGSCVAGTDELHKDVATIQGLQCLLGNTLTVFIALIGLAAFVMVVVGAFRWLLSGGNTKGTETARNTITYAIVGIIVALSAFIIVNLISAFTGIDAIKTLRVPQADEIYTNTPPEQCSARGATRCNNNLNEFCDGSKWVSIGTGC